MALGRGLESLIPKQQKPPSDEAVLDVAQRQPAKPSAAGSVKQESVFYI